MVSEVQSNNLSPITTQHLDFEANAEICFKNIVSSSQVSDAAIMNAEIDLSPSNVTQAAVNAGVLPETQAIVREQNKILVQKSIANFSNQIHQKLAKSSSSSVCFAPLSIVAVLGMVLKAMPQEEKQKFLATMELGQLPEAAVHTALMDILDDLSSASGDLCSIRFANAIAMADPSQTDPKYLEEISQQYKGELFPVEGNDLEKVCATINGWISNKTEKMIPNLLKPTDFPPEPLVAVLLNAMYFSAKWKEEFGEAFNDTFTFASGQQAEVKMMSIEKRLRFHNGGDFKMVEVPYKSPEGHNLAHILFLPNDPKNLQQLEERLTPEFVKRCRGSGHRQKVDLKMPKIEADIKAENLMAIFREIGLPIDSYLPSLHPAGHVGNFIHQAKLSVDEKGTKGAAATAAIITKECISYPQTTFHADHDYAYLIVDGDNILFQGNVKDENVLVKA